MFLHRWSRSPLTILTGIVAVVYGVGFALGDSVGLHERILPSWTWAGALLLAVLFVASLAAAARGGRRGGA